MCKLMLFLCRKIEFNQNAFPASNTDRELFVKQLFVNNIFEMPLSDFQVLTNCTKPVVHGNQDDPLRY